MNCGIFRYRVEHLDPNGREYQKDIAGTYIPTNGANSMGRKAGLRLTVSHLPYPIPTVYKVILYVWTTM